MTKVQRFASARLPTTVGEFTVVGFRDESDTEHVVLVRGDVGGSEVLVRVHSECLTGDVFGSSRCDCGPQLVAAMAAIEAAGRGVLVYCRGHEGRGIGLMSKLETYALQDDGLDTVEANERLGFPADSRDYRAAAAILAALEVESVRLMTNNPVKRTALEEAGVEVVALCPLQTVPTASNRGYLEAKRTKLGHLLDPAPDSDA